MDRVDDLLRAALKDVGDHEFFKSIIHSNLAWVALCRFEPARAADHARAAIALAERVTQQSALRVALGVLAEAYLLLGLETEPTMLRASAIDVDLAPGETVHPARIRGTQLLREGKIAEASRAIREADRHLVEAGLELMRHDTLPVLSEVECAAGDWPAAAGHADEGYDIVVCAGLDEIRDQMLYAKAHAAALMGRVDEARRDATEGVSLAAVQGNLWGGWRTGACSGSSPSRWAMWPKLFASSIRQKGSWPAAGSPSPVPSRSSPIWLKPWSPSASSIARNRWWIDFKSRAQPLIVPSPSPRRRDAALSSRRAWAIHQARSSSSSGRSVSMNAWRSRSNPAHAPHPWRDASADEAEAEARDSLAGARAVFEFLGAPLWEARADEALARIGGRSASPTELSETERRVADIVAQGLTNKETAERLFMSVKTVESGCVASIRLGVRSRTELARRHGSSLARRPGSSQPDGQT